MLFHLKPAILIFWVFSICFGITGFTILHPAAPHTSLPIPHDPSEGEDTIKYRGYRLDLTQFEVQKRTDDWVKIRCTIVNSGRVNVDFSKKGTEHWVQVNFDQSLFDNKLGGLRENIRQALYDDDFKLPAGQTLREKELKVFFLLPKKNAAAKPRNEGFEVKPEIATNEEPESENPAVLTGGKGGVEDDPTTQPTTKPGISDDCPDIYFQRLRVIEQDDKWATIEYNIANKGHGLFKLFDKEAKNEERLIVKAFISGVPTLSRGALPVGTQVIKPQPGQSGDLLPGDVFTGRMKIDVRKKTRYMKSLILSLDSDQFKLECDKTNNADAVILD
jgi:hypothetical protein